MGPHIAPRTLPRIHISRPRLLQQLSAAVRSKLTVVCADAGYGKTTLVTEFSLASQSRAEWYVLTAADRDVARLAAGLENCLRRLAVFPDPKGSRRGAFRRPSEPTVSVLLESLARQTRRLGPEVSLLVIDDYQKVEEEDDINLLLGSLIQTSPPSLRFIVLSRSLPGLPLPSLSSKQELSILQEHDLAFTKEETLAFLRSDAGIHLDDATASLVHQRTEGWAAGIAMVSQSLRYGDRDRVMAILKDPAASAWLVYDYLAQEVFDRQDPSVQEFLVKTSILGMLSGRACDHILNTNASQRTLLALEEAGLFTTAADPRKQTFRYHQLFHQFLRQKLQQREAPQTITDLYLRAARHFEGEEQWEDCVYHYLQVGDHLQAAKVVEAVGERYIMSGYIQTVEYWLRSLPDSITATRPWLLALRGRLSHMAVRHGEAVEYLERAQRLFRASGEQYGQAWAEGELGYVAFRCRQLRTALRQLESALSMAPRGTLLRSLLLVMKAQAHREIGLVEDSISTCREALKELALVDDEIGRTWCRSRINRMVAHAQLETGNLDAAGRSAREALDFCIRHQIGDYEESWALAQLGAVLWAVGDFDAAIESLNRSHALTGKYVRHQQHTIGLWLGNCLRDKGLYAEADRAYAESALEAELERVFLAVLAGCGEHIHSDGIAVCHQFRSSESMTIRTTADVVLAILHRTRGDPSTALIHVRDGVHLLRAHGFRLRLASALLHQARIEYDLSRPSEASASLGRALELAVADHYYHFFWWDPDAVAFLCQKALAENIYSGYVSQLVKTRLDQRFLDALTPLLHDRRRPVRQRAESLLASIPNQSAHGSESAVVSACQDPVLRSYLSSAVSNGFVTYEHLRALRIRFGLSWREVQIAVEYYLRPSAEPSIPAGPVRRECAQRLGISENTLRCHVNRIRQKLGLPSFMSREHVARWLAGQSSLQSS